MINYNEYLKRKDEGELPDGLVRFRHSISWPINPETTNFHIGQYFTRDHDGIDIQVLDGTKVYSSARTRLIGIDVDPRDMVMTNFALLDEKTSAVYALGHLSRRNMSEKIPLKDYFFDLKSDIIFDEGEFVAEVIGWADENEFGITKEIKKAFGKSYHHLHFGVQFCEKEEEIEKAWRNNRNLFNPLLILKEIMQ